MVIILLRDETDACALAHVLHDAGRQGVSPPVACPPVRGVDFFSADDSDLDAWWRDAVPANAVPVYLVADEPGLTSWIKSVDGTFFVGASEPEALRAYRDLERVRAFIARHPVEYAIELAEATRGSRSLDETQADRLQEDASPWSEGAASQDPPPHPFDLLAQLSAAPTVADARAETHSLQEPRLRTESSHVRRWVRRLTSRREHPQVLGDAELAALLARRAPIIVAVGSRKGGVGKTSHAAGMAICSGEALDLIGHRAALVDANLANPDAWGQLALAGDVVTVRDAIAALVDNRDVPRPVHSTTPALACFPERRETSEYSHLEISRFAEHLRHSYSVSIVDLSNRLPDITGGPEASAVAHWLGEADVLVLPTASAKQDFNGVLDYLETPGLPPTVVAHLRARSRRNRDHPLTHQYLAAIAQRVDRVVELPDDAERVRFAVFEGVPVQQVAPALRLAYRALTQAVAEVARVPV